MSWSESLIKLANYEVETLQKRLAEVGERRTAAERRLATLEADGRAELAREDGDPLSGFYRSAFLEALRTSKAEVRATIVEIESEDQDVRDALIQAFETQKKYERVAETARAISLREQARRETAALDELGLRKRAL